MSLFLAFRSITAHLRPGAKLTSHSGRLARSCARMLAINATKGKSAFFILDASVSSSAGCDDEVF